MVSGFSLFALAAALLLCFGIPVAGGLKIRKSWGVTGKAVTAGAGVFVIFQMAFRLPLLTFLFQKPGFQIGAAAPGFVPLIMGITAGIFEEGGRWTGLRVLGGKRPSWREGLGFAWGYAGTEVWLLGGITYLNNLAAAVSINAGTFPAPGAGEENLSALENLKATLITTKGYWYLVGTAERILTMGIQGGLTFLVLWGLRSRRIWPWFLALALHTGIETTALLLKNSENWQAAELWILLWGAGAGFAFFRYIRPLLTQETPREARIPKKTNH